MGPKPASSRPDTVLTGHAQKQSQSSLNGACRRLFLFTILLVETGQKADGAWYQQDGNGLGRTHPNPKEQRLGRAQEPQVPDTSQLRTVPTRDKSQTIVLLVGDVFHGSIPHWMKYMTLGGLAPMLEVQA